MPLTAAAGRQGLGQTEELDRQKGAVVVTVREKMVRFLLSNVKVSKYHDVMKSKETKTDKDDRKSYPLRLPKTTLKALKHRALEQETSVQKILEGLIEGYLNSGEPEAK